MYFLIYISSAATLYTQQDLEEILIVSRRNNSQSGITGVLLYHDGSILQVLEGEELAVTNQYHRILMDERHRGAIKIMEGYSEQRYFPEWLMGFRNLNASQWNSFEGYLPISHQTTQFERKAGTAKDMATFIQAFCRVNFNLLNEGPTPSK